MKSYKHFTLNERKYLQESLEKGDSIREIAKALGRNASTISRGIKRNWSKKISGTITGPHKLSI